MVSPMDTFFTSIGCMDGRVQDVIANFGREKFGVEYADTITEAGIVGLLAKSPVSHELMEDLKFKVTDVSVGKHHSAGVIVHGHAECAGNPVTDEKQKEDIKKSVEVIRSLVNSIPVFGLFVHRSISDPEVWVAQEVV
jgi:hypothetical protein